MTRHINIYTVLILLLCCCFVVSAVEKKPVYLDTRQPIAVGVQDLLDRHLERIVEPGIFEVMLGKSSDNIELRGEFDILADKINAMNLNAILHLVVEILKF